MIISFGERIFVMLYIIKLQTKVKQPKGKRKIKKKNDYTRIYY